MATLRSNIEIWNAMRVKYPTFGEIAPEATVDTFTERGFTALQRYPGDVVNTFFGLLVRVSFNRLNLAESKDYFDEIGYGEKFDNAYGGVIQRISVDMLKSINPLYKNLTDGSSVDPFKVRIPRTKERFFSQNQDYQNVVSLQEYQIKTIFLDEYGFDAFSAGIVAASLAGYAESKYLAKVECVNEILNSETFPLQDTQKITATFADPAKPTAEELRNQLIIPIQTLLNSANAMSSTDAFNSYKFRSKFEKDKLVMLVRAGWMESVEANILSYAFNNEYLKMPIEYHVVNDFGGLEYYADSAFETRVYPAYNSLGEQVGFETTEGQTVETPTYSNDDVYVKDPNEDVIALISDKRSIFHAVQNEITVFPHVNGAGLYTSYWQSSPNNTIKYDPIYTNIAVYKAQAV